MQACSSAICLFPSRAKGAICWERGARHPGAPLCWARTWIQAGWGHDHNVTTLGPWVAS